MSVSLKEENNGEELEKKLTVNNQNIYYYGIDGVFVCNGENTCAELKQALGYKQIDLEKLKAIVVLTRDLRVNLAGVDVVLAILEKFKIKNYNDFAIEIAQIIKNKQEKINDNN